MSNRSRVFALSFIIAFFALFGLTCGFAAYLHLQHDALKQSRSPNFEQPGNASPTVRAAIVQKLHTFQNGYARRDPKAVDSFSDNLFSKDGDILILGTDSGEWIRGTPAAKTFIKEDWRAWGDLRLECDRAAVWSSGNVAWTTTVGLVHWNKRERPLRFTAILILEDGRWVFRQMHFQWDDDGPSANPFLHPRAWLSMLSGPLH
jgi:hypothetical protein